jgi:NitT/TauT family transport system permease protein
VKTQRAPRQGLVQLPAETLTAEPNAESTSAPAVQLAKSSGRLLVVSLQIIIVVVIFGLWEWLASTGHLSDAFFSRPSRIFPALYRGLFTTGDLRSALGITLYETIIGFLIASALGFVVGVLFYQFPLLERVWRPFVTAANNMPRLALTPLFILWLGVGKESHIFLVITMVFFVMLLNTLAGLNTASRDQLLLARVLGASRIKTYTRFLLPSAVPSLFVGLQLGLTYSFMGAVIGEIITGGRGLGAQIAIYSATYSSDKVFADLFLIAILATILSFAIKLLESRLLRWRIYELRSAK